MYELAIKIILAHVLGDFVLQSNKAVKDICQKGFRSIYFYSHIAIHGLLLLIVTGFQKQFIVPIFLLTLSHFLIDSLTKIVFKSIKYRLYIFIVDQLFHFLAIGIFISYFYNYQLDWNYLLNNQIYLFLLAFFVVTNGVSVIIKLILNKFTQDDIIHFDNLDKKGKDHAGKVIGILERLFIFGFVCLNFWEGVGFFLAAKSIFRFGDLKENKDLKLTEYILIGTLLSFGFAILVATIYLKIAAYLTNNS
jgi:hypothetical protein